jgi:hypothetical protein
MLLVTALYEEIGLELVTGIVLVTDLVLGIARVLVTGLGLGTVLVTGLVLEILTIFW